MNSPMTIASVRNAPLSRATRRFGRITATRIRGQPAPRLWAASVRLRTSIGRRPVSTARYMYGNDRTTYAADEQDVAAHVRGGQRERGRAVGLEEPEHEHDRRDDERQQRDELDERPGARHPQPDPERGRHQQRDADDDRDDADEERVAEALTEPGLLERTLP